jgi:hypothetical protein
MNKYIIVIISIIVIILIILLITFFYYEKDHILYYLSFSSNKAGLPTPSSVLSIVKNIIQQLPKDNYTLVDFGCGQGNFINHMYPYVTNIVGIENHIDQASSTMKRFIFIPSITIKCIDMQDYLFTNNSTILYMYEPLWTMKKEESINIYHTVMKNVIKVSSLFYIIYVSGIRQLLDNSFFEQYNFKTLYYTRIKRGLGWNGNHVYLFKSK